MKRSKGASSSRWGCRPSSATLKRMESAVASVKIFTVEAAGENLMALEKIAVRDLEDAGVGVAIEEEGLGGSGLGRVRAASSRWTVLASAMLDMVSMACWARSRREHRRIWSGARPDSMRSGRGCR